MNCQLCHSGSILGKSYVGLPNSTLDMQHLEEDLNATEGVKTAYDFSMGETRGLNGPTPPRPSSPRCATRISPSASCAT
jgi:hypothetical protein